MVAVTPIMRINTMSEYRRLAIEDGVQHLTKPLS